MSTDKWPQGRSVTIAPRANQPSINLTVHEAGDGPAVVFCHGFPELAYSWRHQVPAVAAARFYASSPHPRRDAGLSAPPPVPRYGSSRRTGGMGGGGQPPANERPSFPRP